MITSYNTDSKTLLFGRALLTDMAKFSAGPPAVGGAGALNITWIAPTPPAWVDGAFLSDVPMRPYFVLSGTWVACNIVVTSPVSGKSETIAVAAGFTGGKRAAGSFLASEITSITTSKDPGSTARLDIYWSWDNGVKECASGATAAAVAGINLTKLGIGVAKWGRVGQAGDNIAIEKDSTAASSIAIGTELYLLASGTAREKKAGDTTGVVIGTAGGPAFVVPGIMGKTFIPLALAPRDL